MCIGGGNTVNPILCHTVTYGTYGTWGILLNSVSILRSRSCDTNSIINTITNTVTVTLNVREQMALDTGNGRRRIRGCGEIASKHSVNSN